MRTKFYAVIKSLLFSFFLFSRHQFACFFFGSALFCFLIAIPRFQWATSTLSSYSLLVCRCSHNTVFCRSVNVVIPFTFPPCHPDTNVSNSAYASRILILSNNVLPAVFVTTFISAVSSSLWVLSLSAPPLCKSVGRTQRPGVFLKWTDVS
jgi:hypothetical protein